MTWRPGMAGPWTAARAARSERQPCLFTAFTSRGSPSRLAPQRGAQATSVLHLLHTSMCILINRAWPLMSHVKFDAESRCDALILSLRSAADFLGGLAKDYAEARPH